MRGADRLADLPHRLRVALEPLSDLDLDSAEAFAGAFPRELRHLLRCPVRHRVAERDALAHPAAKERVHGHPERLAGEVPERHLHPRDRELAVGKLCLHGAQRARDRERIAPDEGGSEPLVHVAVQERTPAGEHARYLPEAGQPLVGAYLDDAVLGDFGRSECGANHRSEGAARRPV